MELKNLPLEVCDFCQAPNPTWEFPCGNFVTTTGQRFNLQSDDAWAACEKCKADVESGLALPALVIRIAKRMGNVRFAQGLNYVEIDGTGLAEALSLFVAKRCGPPVPLLGRKPQ